MYTNHTITGPSLLKSVWSFVHGSLGTIEFITLAFIYARRSCPYIACDLCHECVLNSVYGLVSSINIAILILYGVEFILHYLLIISVKFALL